MDENKNAGKEEKKKGFIERMLDKIDKKMEEKSKKSPCCGGSDKDKGSPCC